MDKVKLTIPKKSEYISTIRLTSSALSNINSFNVDDIEDIKVIVSEICIFFINNIEENEKPFEVEYIIDNDKFKVKVTDLNKGKVNKKNEINDEMCILIIESLSDKYELDLEYNKISFEKYMN